MSARGGGAEVMTGVRLGYRPELDGLRAVAVAVVFLLHASLERAFTGGFLGVDLFFVLSGFLITRLLLEEWSSAGTIPLRHFYARRAGRLLPALVALCIAAIALGSLQRSGPGVHESALGAAGALFYFTNFFGLLGWSSPLSHTWSLSVEEQFYLLWPIILIGLLAWGGRRRVSQFALALVVLASVQVVIRFHAGVDTLNLYEGPDAQGMIFLMSGCLMATLIPTIAGELRRHPVGRVASALTVPALVALGLLVIRTNSDSPFYFDGGYLLVACTICLVVIAALSGGMLTRFLRLRPVAWIGALSYGIYLWSFPMIYWVSAEMSPSTPHFRIVVAIITLALTMVCATTSYYLIELPIRARVRARLARGPKVPDSAGSALLATPGG
jgi:peptidoglycan/LPS O-acetylase OafA/YrhL